MKFRVTVEIDLPEGETSADDALSWMNSILNDGVGCAIPTRIVSAIPVKARDPVENLKAAIEHVERHYPIPRCKHGNALRDHAGDVLSPSCGCVR